jgi:uncharacterized protein YjbI with pentapeptide repeats
MTMRRPMMALRAAHRCSLLKEKVENELAKLEQELGGNQRSQNAQHAGCGAGGADFSDANLSRVVLTGADLSGANLTNAMVTDEQLDACKSLKSVAMPDGSNTP